MDKTAFFKLSYGVYIVASRENDRDAGCVVNTVTQVTSAPARITVAVNKDNYTAGVIARTGRFTAMALDESASMELIGVFGFKSSRDTDKFAGFEASRDLEGLPYLTQSVCARFSARVVGQLDAGSHILFLGEVTEAQTLAGGPPMTYSYYHTVKKGKTPPKASAYVAPEEKTAAQEKSSGGFTCRICGYHTDAASLPEDFRCPICNAPASQFDPGE
jgi:flavin reductase (DIM6/NTAB) family NADH-FMN oxidoreductase RutF